MKSEGGGKVNERVMVTKSTARHAPAVEESKPEAGSSVGLLPRDGSQAALWDVPAQYLKQLPRADKRNGGRVYTPAHLVTFILEQARFHEVAGAPGATLLDPACGGGAFLVGAVVAIAERLRETGTAIERGVGRIKFLGAVEAALWGVDIDPRACALTCAGVAGAVAQLSPGPLPQGFFRGNVVEADFLTSKLDALTQIREKGVLFIVGNPPYVPATRISSRYKAELRLRYQTAGGRLDLYTVFLERSLELLRAGGLLAMVTPDKYLMSHSARALRSYIVDHGAVRRIARFKSHKVFEGAATVPCVTVVEREGKASGVTMMSCAARPGRSGRVRVLERYSLPAESIKDERWDLVPPRLLGLARAIQSSHPALEEKALRISAGPATGRDDLFVFENCKAPDLEPELTRPVVRGRDVLAFGIRDPALSILLPFHFDRRSGRGELIELADYPKARAFLEKHRKVLASRHCVRVWEKAWFDLHDQAPIDLAREAKILVPDVANSNRFAVDEGRYLPLHSAYYILAKPGVDLHFLSAVLNSRVSTFLMRLLAPVVKDGFSRYRRQFLAVLPIPDAGAGVTLEMAKAARDGDARAADDLATTLFDLSKTDVRAVNRFLDDRH